MIGSTLRRLAVLSCGVLCTPVSDLHGAEATAGAPTVVLVAGAAGEEGFREKFLAWGAKWETAATRGGAKVLWVGRETPAGTEPLSELRRILNAEPKSDGTDLWLVLLGHGTFDGKDAKFNLEGDDLSAEELSALLKPIQRRTAIINCASSSGAFLKPLSAEGRTVLTSTRSGSEMNFSRYGEYLAGAIADPEADLDKDGQTSLLEAHLIASRRVADFYNLEGRLATEHSLIDDNGDGLGTPADWFRGIRAVKKAADGAEPDGLRANQLCLVPNEAERRLPPEIRRQRDALELEIARLRDRKATLAETEYYTTLEPLLQKLARLYQAAAPTPAPETPAAPAPPAPPKP